MGVPVNKIVDLYQLNTASLSCEPYGTGLINNTWLLEAGPAQFILQKINESVFTDPVKIDKNINLISSAYKANCPEQLFVSPLPNRNGETLTSLADEGYFRLFPFIVGSHTIDRVDDAAQAYEAAVQFARFTRCMHVVDPDELFETIPGFHNLEWRYQQFVDAIGNGNKVRVLKSQQLIGRLLGLDQIVAGYSKIVQRDDFVKRVMHHDTKISNVLFDKNNKGLCVIDLDTLMPGYVISDVGDMMRTYLSPVTEEESNLEFVKVRVEIYKAIVDGYLSEMDGLLTPAERSSFFYAACFMIYMQALRFITDYLNDDKYYAVNYPAQNLVRAKNQLALLEDLLNQESILSTYPSGL